MILKVLTFFLVMLCVACTPFPQYEWQDTRVPEREDVTTDLDDCREFASRQYKPGIPAGEEYQQQSNSDMGVLDTTTTGEWRPDRSPNKTVNVHALPIHDVQTDYTGYPGELDYHPNYLDDIVEKCMNDRGWVYDKRKENK